MKLKIISFGFKNGTPAEASYIIDCRCLRNPEKLFSRSGKVGTDKEVQQEVMAHPLSNNLFFLAIEIINHRANIENKQAFTLGVGCTGGHHRSVTLAEIIGQWAKERGYEVIIMHRDLTKP